MQAAREQMGAEEVHILGHGEAALVEEFSLHAMQITVAIEALERLIAETADLVANHMPEVDTSHVRKSLGARRQRWTPA